MLPLHPAWTSTSRYSMPSPLTELPIDPIGLNRASENGDPNTMAFSENHDARPNVRCGKAFGKTKCHSFHRPTHRTPREARGIGFVERIVRALRMFLDLLARTSRSEEHTSEIPSPIDL